MQPTYYTILMSMSCCIVGKPSLKNDGSAYELNIVAYDRYLAPFGIILPQ